jgi:hypothetical protein
MVKKVRMPFGEDAPCKVDASCAGWVCSMGCSWREWYGLDFADSIIAAYSFPAFRIRYL